LRQIRFGFILPQTQSEAIIKPQTRRIEPRTWVACGAARGLCASGVRVNL